jgi:hypothetical protein
MSRIFNMLILLAVTAGCEAQGMGRLAEVAIIDRDSGAVLTPYYYRGEYWIAGRPGARYAIEIHNRLGERLLAVTSVDGVNVLSGANAGWDQAGYVFSAGERYQITGWRKTDAQVATFTFTESANSYAERTGRPANVGVIGVAVFRERQPQPAYAPMYTAPAAPLAGAAAPEARAQAEDSVSRPAAMASPMLRAPANEPKLGTGHGEREYSYVSRTDFLKMQAQPNEVIRIRYGSFDSLVAMGIVKRPRPAWPAANPFPASPDQQYVPDPPG